MRCAVVLGGLCIDLIEVEDLRMVRRELAPVRYPAGARIIPVTDTSAAEPGAVASILQTWPSGRPRRVRFTRADGAQSEDTHGDTD